MRPKDADRVQHMLDATHKARQRVVGRSRSDLDTDETLTLALTRLLEILGEAAKNVSETTRMLAPGIPWRQIGSTRNRLIHGYFEVDLDIMWDILTRDLPSLQDKLEQLLSRLV